VGPTTDPRRCDTKLAQYRAALDAGGDALGLLHNADQTDRAEVYARIGLQMTHRPGTETMIAGAISPAIDGVLDVCPRPDVGPAYTIGPTDDILISQPELSPGFRRCLAGLGLRAAFERRMRRVAAGWCQAPSR
jgi:hypothetical protein